MGADEAWGSEVVLRINPPTGDEIGRLAEGPNNASRTSSAPSNRQQLLMPRRSSAALSPAFTGGFVQTALATEERQVQTMALCRVPPEEPSRSGVPVGNPCPEVLPPRQPFNIDDLAASPWIGLHYRHEFLLHHRHELLEQHLRELPKSPPNVNVTKPGPAPEPEFSAGLLRGAKNGLERCVRCDLFRGIHKAAVGHPVVTRTINYHNMLRCITA